jgi:hypothetical protein
MTSLKGSLCMEFAFLFDVISSSTTITDKELKRVVSLVMVDRYVQVPTVVKAILDKRNLCYLLRITVAIQTLGTPLDLGATPSTLPSVGNTATFRSVVGWFTSCTRCQPLSFFSRQSCAKHTLTVLGSELNTFRWHVSYTCERCSKDDEVTQQRNII